MTIKKWLEESIYELESAGIGTARLDLEILLADGLGKNRAWIIAHQDEVLSKNIIEDLELRINLRKGHTPLAYIRQKTEFYGRSFYVDQSVLEPRPESETMIEMCLENILEFSNNQTVAVCDIGTGSGALAITIKLERPDIEVFGTDIDPACLEVAKRNKEIHNTRVNFLEGDLLSPLRKLPDNIPQIIIANLPYIADDYHINTAAAREPKTAIFGGPDGLDLYRNMFKQIEKSQYPPKLVLTESLPPQHDSLAHIASNSGYKLTKTNDFIQMYQMKI